MRTLPFAARTLRRQPARATLGILGIAAVGALLFDMLLLSRGLVLSMRELLDRAGFDVRVTATASLPGVGPRIEAADDLARRLAALPEIDEAVALRFADGQAADVRRRRIQFDLVGADASRRRAWSVLRGRDLDPAASGSTRETLVNEALARALAVGPGDNVAVRASCTRDRTALPPVTLRVVGVAGFPFESAGQRTAAMHRRDLASACGTASDGAADLILVAAAPGFDPEAARAAAAQTAPEVAVITNAQLVGRLDEAGFSYFRQISTVLATVTTAFGLLLITVLLTVSVNQRLGTIAALRAIGFSRRRMVADVITESALLVFTGGVLAIPLGLGLASWLDRILKRMPGLPADLHFFVFERRALLVYFGLLVATAVLAALYPIRMVSRLPIAATLRDEVTS